MIGPFDMAIAWDNTVKRLKNGKNNKNKDMEIKFVVKKLDKGFIVNVNGKETAIEDFDSLESHFVSRFLNEIKKSFNRLSIEESIINIDIKQQEI